MTDDIVEGMSEPITRGAAMWAVMMSWQPHWMPALKVVISHESISSHVFRLCA